MDSIIIQIISAFFGSLGFGMIFRIRGLKLLLGSIGGMCAWSVCLLVEHLGGGAFAQYFFASFFATMFAEIFARVMKTPTTILLVPTIIPLVPGGSLFYTMENAITQQWGQFTHYGHLTLICTMAIASGIMVVSSIIKLYFALRYHNLGNHNLGNHNYKS